MPDRAIATFARGGPDDPLLSEAPRRFDRGEA